MDHADVLCAVEKDGSQPRGPSPHDVHVVQVAHVQRRPCLGARTLEGQAKQPWVGLLEAFFVRVEDVIEEARQPRVRPGGGVSADVP